GASCAWWWGRVVFFFSSRRRHTRSSTVRGLGDVYKRQPPSLFPLPFDLAEALAAFTPIGLLRLSCSTDESLAFFLAETLISLEAVSYTHLTLPTKRIV